MKELYCGGDKMTEFQRPEKRKNKKIVLLALLLLLVMVTGAFIQTLAKYMTAGTVDDSAVVAEFGLDIPNTIDLFSDSYTNVQANEGGKKIIAPGTSGHYTFSVTGTSEVAYKVSADISITYSDEWAGDTPLRFSLDGNTWTTLALFEEALATALASNVMAPNTTYSNAQTIYWMWPFHVSSASDILDTAMGEAAATGTVPSVTVTIEVTAVQVA